MTDNHETKNGIDTNDAGSLESSRETKIAISEFFMGMFVRGAWRVRGCVEGARRERSEWTHMSCDVI
jgi:hypothetical protein